MNRIENKANDVLRGDLKIYLSGPSASLSGTIQKLCKRQLSKRHTDTQTKRMKSSDPLEDLDKSSAKSEDYHEIHEIRGLYSRNPR